MQSFLFTFTGFRKLANHNKNSEPSNLKLFIILRLKQQISVIAVIIQKSTSNPHSTQACTVMEININC